RRRGSKEGREDDSHGRVVERENTAGVEAEPSNPEKQNGQGQPPAIQLVRYLNALYPSPLLLLSPDLQDNSKPCRSCRAMDHYATCEISHAHASQPASRIPNPGRRESPDYGDVDATGREKGRQST